MQALLPAHRLQLLLDERRPNGPFYLHVSDVALPPVVRQPLLHVVEHLQRRVGAIPLVQALLPAHRLQLLLDERRPDGPFRLHASDVALPPVVCQERHQLIDIPQLWNAFAAARMHHKCLLLLCRMPNMVVVRRWDEERSGGG